MTEAGREGKVRWWKVESTDGDFITTARAFVAVPGMRLPFELDEGAVLRMTLQAAVYARPVCSVGLQIDGNCAQFCSTIPELAGPADLVPMVLDTVLALPAGVHSVGMVMAMKDGGPGGAGPKDWSPRRRIPGGARLVRSPGMPATLLVVRT